ncbi:unnamed protein product [Meloidogyne enterolobii]|uniref:Uncharacterized protein n=1 Tax=Meloidogyne enterolobii TaxID=390850 RepID=A0ACB1AK46_MELEN
MIKSDVKSAKQKWKHLCDYYSKLKKPKASGSDGKDVKWPYLNLMNFLEGEKENCSRFYFSLYCIYKFIVGLIQFKQRLFQMMLKIY